MDDDKTRARQPFFAGGTLRRALPLFALFFFTSLPQLSGTSVRMVNLFELVQLADKVFWGRCVSIKENTEGFLPVVEYVFDVRRGIKGVRSGERITFVQIQTGGPGAVGVPGVPQYRKGEEVLLFLHKESRLGLTSPVGLTQGAFRLQRVKRGEIQIANLLENRNLNHDLKQDQLERAGISREERRQIEAPNPMPLQSFISVVEKVRRYEASRGESPR